MLVSYFFMGLIRIMLYFKQTDDEQMREFISEVRRCKRRDRQVKLLLNRACDDKGMFVLLTGKEVKLPEFKTTERQKRYRWLNIL